MKTIAEILAEVQQLQTLTEDRDAKSVASHAAVQNVADVTTTQNGLVAQAQASATVAINSAQADADSAVAATTAANQAVSDAIDQIEADLTALKASP
jgi:hypothetical protein